MAMASPEPQDENQRFIVLRRFRDQPDAFLSRSLLDSAEIECYLADENTIRMDWFWSNLLGRIKLCVRKADADTASSLLGQNVPEKFDVEGLGEYQQPRCPKCLSLEVSFQGFNKPVDYARVVLGGPLSLHRSLWECDSCGHQWPESSEKPPANLLTSISSIFLIVIAAETAGFLLLSVWFSFVR
jgi:hypothetical protein